ncbi:NACHT domain-containing protein [bacterium]|nr:NACHT domain-containing protein [bacterium]
MSQSQVYGKFLSGLSYRIDRANDDFLLVSRTTPTGVKDAVYIRCRTADPSDTEWERHLSEFERNKREQPKTKRFLVYPSGAIADAGSVADGRRLGFEVLSEGEFLDRFANLIELSEKIRLGLEGLSAKERQEWAVLQRTYTEQEVVVGEALQESASSFILEDWSKRPGAQVLVLLAPAGHGKTALTKFIASTMLKSYQESKSSPLPILIPFASYRRLVTFRALILEFFDDHRHPIAMDTFNLLLSAGRLLLVLDGFDELCEQAGLVTARENLRTFAEGISTGGKFVLTSRTIFYRTNIEGASLVSDVIDETRVTHAELQPLDEPRQRRFLQKLSRNEKLVSRTLQVLKDVPQIKELAGSPFLLKELHDIFTASEQATYTAAAKSSDLYAWMLDRLCERERDRQNYDLSNKDQTAFLEELANWIFTDTPSTASHALALDTGAVQFMVEYVFDDYIRRFPDPDSKKSELIEKLTHHAVLNAVGGEADRVQFIHHTWKDFLVARRLERSIRRASARKEWEEVAHVLLTRPLPEWVAMFLASGLEEAELKILCQDAPRLRDPRIFPKVLSVALNHAEWREPTDSERQTELFLRLLGGYTFKGKLLSSVRFARLNFHSHSFDSAEIRDGVFFECNLQGSSFRSSRLTNTIFEACDLRAADFTRSTLNNITCPDCDVAQADFRGSSGLSLPTLQLLSDQGALVDMIGIIPRHPPERRDIVKDLLKRVLAKFRYDASKKESALVRGIELGNRRFIGERLVKRLVNSNYLTVIDRGKSTPVIIKRNDKRNPEVWQFVDTGEESSELSQLIENLLHEYPG